MTKRDFIPAEYVERRIVSLRGHNVLIDADLAELYGVETRALNQAVRRNIDRFPEDFAFRLTVEEFADLRSQFVISSWGGRRTPPYAFTEHGAIMVASVLRSERAIEMSVFVVRAFVKLRGILSTHVEMLRTLEELEDRVGEHDEALRSIIATIRQLMAPASRLPRIGFDAEDTDTRSD